MKSNLILIEKPHAGVTVLTLNRPEKRNALSGALMKELCGAVRSVGREKTQRVLILRGAGEVFCAGLDLNEAAEPGREHSSARLVAQMLLTVSEAPVVTIAVIHGAAMAGGAGLMSACDLAVAAAGTRIGYPEVRRGLVAALVSAFLRRQVGERHLRELFFTGEPITAERAFEMGLVNRVVSRESLEEEVQKMTRSILQGSPEALARTKRLLRNGLIKREVERALTEHMGARNSRDAKEGISAFLEKRLPRWAAEIQV